MVFWHIKFQHIPSLMSFILTDYTQYLWLKVSLTNILKKIHIVEKKSYHSKHVNSLKLQPIQLLQAVASSTSSQVHFDSIRGQPSLLPHFTDDQTKTLVTFSWHFFMWKKYCGLLSNAVHRSFLSRTSGLPFCFFQSPKITPLKLGEVLLRDT